MGRSTTTFSTEQTEAIRAGVRKREATSDPAGWRGLDRISVEVVGPLRYTARDQAHPDWPMEIGEPVERGGTGDAASPLSHFLAGAAACLLNQFVRLAVADELPVELTRASARGEFSRRSGGAFERIKTEVHGTGELDEVTAADLTDRAERLCYVHATLSRAIPLTTVLVLDGREAARRESTPSGEAR